MKKKARVKKNNIYDWINILVIVLITVIMFYPYWNTVVLAFNDGMDAMFGGIYLWPRKFTIANLQLIMRDQKIWRATFLTILNVVCRTLSSLVVTAAAAYAISKRGMPYRNKIIWFFLLPTYIPSSIIAVLLQLRYMHLLNTQLLYWVTTTFAFYNMIIIRSFIQGLPESLEEAAIIDGANQVTIFSRVIMPLCKPVLATVALWLMVGTWNDYGTSLYFITDERLYSLQYVIMEIIKKNDLMQELARENTMLGIAVDSSSTPTTESLKSAAIVFSTLPIIAAYPFLQKYFVKGITVGAIKD